MVRPDNGGAYVLFRAAISRANTGGDSRISANSGMSHSARIFKSGTRPAEPLVSRHMVT
jgi:hypothetical protein